MHNKIEVQLSKKKIILLVIGSLTFIAFGLLMAVHPEKFVSMIFKNIEVIRFLGIIAVLFFGLCLVFLIKKLSANKPGLIIDESGIIDNSNATSVGLIEWDDITGIKKIQIVSNKILIIQTNNPDKYISRAKNFISRKVMEANQKRYGSPISIISNSLKINFNDLEALILNKLKEVKNRSPR